MRLGNYRVAPCRGFKSHLTCQRSKWGDDAALRALAEKLEKERLALYFPMVFRKGMTIHLSAGHIVRFDGSVYMIMKTFGGPVVLKRALQQEGVATPQPETRKPILVKPILRRKIAGVS